MKSEWNRTGLPFASVAPCLNIHFCLFVCLFTGCFHFQFPHPVYVALVLVFLQPAFKGQNNSERKLSKHNTGLTQSCPLIVWNSLLFWGEHRFANVFIWFFEHFMASIWRTVNRACHCPLVTQGANSEIEFKILFYILVCSVVWRKKCKILISLFVLLFTLSLTQHLSVKLRATIRLHWAQFMFLDSLVSSKTFACHLIHQYIDCIF